MLIEFEVDALLEDGTFQTLSASADCDEEGCGELVLLTANHAPADLAEGEYERIAPLAQQFYEMTDNPILNRERCDCQKYHQLREEGLQWK